MVFDALKFISLFQIWLDFKIKVFLLDSVLFERFYEVFFFHGLETLDSYGITVFYVISLMKMLDILVHNFVAWDGA